MFARGLCGLVLAACVVPAQAGKVVVREWLAAGTVPFEQGADPFEMSPPAGLFARAPVEGAEIGGMRWRKIEAEDEGHVNLLNRGWEQEELVTAWLHAYVFSPAERTAALMVGSDDAIQVFVNGTEVHRNPARRGWTAREDRFPVRLATGWNRLLLRVANHWGGFGASAEFGGAYLARTQADRPDDFIPVRTAGYIDLVEGRLEAPLVSGDDGALALTVVASVRNLGTEPAEGAVLRVVSEDAGVERAGAFTIPPGAHEFSLHVDAREAAAAVAKGAALALRIEWDGGAVESVIPVDASPRELLGIVTGDPPLCADLAVASDDYASLLENWRWGERFLPEEFGRDEPLRDLLDACVRGDARDFRAARGRARDRLEAGVEKIRRQRITFVGNSHIDMAWLWDRDETVEVVEMTFDQALEFMEEFPFFNYAQSQMQAYAWTEELFPEMMQRLDAAVKEGRWIPVGGMWVEPDCNLPSGESFVRQMLYGKGWVRDRYGIDIRIGWNPDSFGYAQTLPMLFQGAGIDYFVTQKIGWNDTTEFPHRLFWWEAPDGSRVLSYFPFTYVDDARPATLAERLEHQQEQQPGLEDMLNLYGVGDHGGGPTREMIERYVAMSEIEAFPRVEHAAPLEFMERVEKKYEGKIPLWDDELYLEYHRGTYTTQARVKARNRGMESALEAGEKFAALAHALVDHYEYPDEKLDGAWLRTLFNQFHDILPGSSIPEVFVDAHEDYDEAEKLVSEVTDEALAVLGAGISTIEGEGMPVVVFNPLSWNRSEVVSVPFEVPEGIHPTMAVVSGDGVRRPVQFGAGKLMFVAEEVPGIGYRTFWLEEGSPEEAARGPRAERTDEGFVLGNDTVRAEIDARTGALRSLVLLPAEREMLGERGGNVLQLFGDVPAQWDAWNIGFTGEQWDVEGPAEVQVIESGPVRAVVRATRRIGASELVQDYVVTAGRPLVEVRTRATWNESHKMLKTAFHFAGEADDATFEIPYGVISRTTRPETDAERAKWEVPGQRWVDLTDRSGEFGLTLVNDSKYGYDAVGSRLRLSLLRAPKYPDPDADIGSHEFAYALYPHEGDWRHADSYRRGAEYNVPLIPRATLRQPGPLPPTNHLIGDGLKSVPNPASSVVLSAFKPVRDKSARPAYVLRVTEVEGRKGTLDLHFPFPIAAAWSANLMEDRGESLPTAENKVTLTIGPHQLKSVLIQPATE